MKLKKLENKQNIFYRKAESEDVLYRAFENIKVKASTESEDNSNLVEFTLTSEDRYKRYDWDIGYYYEELGHNEDEVDLTRLNNKAPFLYEHNASKQLGVFVSAKIVNGKTDCVVRFSKNEFPQEVLLDIKDGIRTKTSGGYVIFEMIYIGKAEDGLPIYRATSWKLVEGSSVSVAADDTVSIKGEKGLSIKSLIKKDENEIEEPVIVAQKVEEVLEKSEPVIEIVDNEKIVNQNRDNEIKTLAKSFNFPENDLNAFLKSDKTVDDFVDVIKNLNNKDKEREKNMSNFSEKDIKDFNIFSLMNSVKSLQNSKEFEISNELKLKSGSNCDFMIPTQLLKKAALNLLHRAYNTGAGNHSGASNLVAEILDASSLIEVLRPLLKASHLGVRTVSGLVGDYALPRKVSGMTSTWVGDSGESTDSNAVYDKVVAKPKILASETVIFELARKQMTPDATMLAIEDMLIGRLQELDRVVFAGGGLLGTNEPIGILNASGVASVAIDTNGGAISRDKLVDLMGALSDANANEDSAKIVTNSKVKSALMKTKVDAGSGLFLDKEFADKLVYTNNIPKNLTKGTGTNLSAAIYGDFSQVVICEWGQPEFILDEITQAKSGKSVVIMRQATDILIKNPKCFSKIVDIIA